MSGPGPRAFTLIEMLVVVGIIGLLIALVTPAVRSARHKARDVQCAGNMRQLAVALIAYADANRGCFPVNSAQAGLFWYLDSVLGRYITSPERVGRAGRPFPGDDPPTSLAGGVFVCPADLPDSVRSYSMNLYASGDVSDFVRKTLESPNPPGRLFRRDGRAPLSRLMLLVESWPELPVQSSRGERFVAQAFAGLVGLPGARFGGAPGVNWTTPPDGTPGRFRARDSQITFYRHDPAAGAMEAPTGQAHFAFADGHVNMLRQSQLVSHGRYSTGAALWSVLDAQIENTGSVLQKE